jgi:type IV pilus assembly protein PilE
MARHLRGSTGLTLVELMIVVAIIAIITAVVMTVFQDIQKKSKLAADNGNVASMRSAVALYYGRHNGIFPGSEAAIEALVTPAPTWQCGTTPNYDTDNGKISFTATIADCP